MIDEQAVMRTIVAVAAELNASLDAPIDLSRGAEAPLYGRDGVLDSLGLVSFLAAVEQALSDETGKPIALADERAVSQRSSPFRTIATLAAYATQQLAAAE